MNSLVFAFGFICLALAVNGEIPDTHSGVREKCFKQEGLGSGELSASGSSTFLQNPKSKCYLKCFIEGLGLWKPDNTIDIEQAIQLIDENVREKAGPLVTKCVNDYRNIPERCERSFQIVKCLHEINPAVFQQLGILEPPQ